MARADETFVESLLPALAEALSEREERLMHARYGLTSGTPRTLEAIAQEWQLTRERVRQLLQRAQRKLRLKGKRDIDRGSTETACASLLLALGYGSNGEGNEQKEKLIALAQSALAYLSQENYALPLLVSLCIPEKEAKTFLRDLLQSVKQQAERKSRQRGSVWRNPPALLKRFWRIFAGHARPLRDWSDLLIWLKKSHHQNRNKRKQ